MIQSESKEDNIEIMQNIGICLLPIYSLFNKVIEKLYW